MEDQLPVYSSEVGDQLALKVVGVHELCFSGTKSTFWTCTYHRAVRNLHHLHQFSTNYLRVDFLAWSSYITNHPDRKGVQH